VTTPTNDAVATGTASPGCWRSREPKVDIGRGGGSISGDNSATMGELFNRITGSAKGSRCVSVEVGGMVSRVLGLILAALSVEIVIEGIRASFYLS